MNNKSLESLNKLLTYCSNRAVILLRFIGDEISSEEDENDIEAAGTELEWLVSIIDSVGTLIREMPSREDSDIVSKTIKSDVKV